MTQKGQILTLLRQIELSIKFDIVNSGRSIIYIEGLQLIISNKGHTSYFNSSLSYQTVQTLMKCRHMRHFIWVFTVCFSTRLVVSSPQTTQSILN